MDLLRLLAASSEVDAGVGAVKTLAEDSYNTFVGIVKIIFPVFIGIILVLGLFFGVNLAIKYAKAEDEEKKKKAKEQLINVIVAVLIAVAFVVILMLILNGNYVKSLFDGNLKDYGETMGRS